MTDTAFLQNLGLIIVAAALFSLLSRRFNLPSIVAFLAAGLVLGPLAGLIEASDALRLLTESGIVLLLFLVGLELTVERIREVGKVALIAGSVQILVTVALAFALSLLTGFPPLAAAVLASALTISSTVVVVKILVEKNESSTGHGQAAIGILLVQDIFVILLLTVLTGLGGGSTGAGAITLALAKAFGSVLLLMGLMIAASRWLLPRPFAWAGQARETIFIWSLSWCFLVVSGAHVLHLSHEIGAFLAGVSLAQLSQSHDLQRRVRPLMNFFVAVFFVTLGIGMRIDVPLILWLKALALSAFVLFGKLAIILLIARKLRFHARQAFYTALMLTQISEFSFIVSTVAVKSGLPVDGVPELLGLVGMLTITISSLLIGKRERLFDWFTKRGLLRNFESSPEDDIDPDALKNHIIIVGMNTLGRELARRLTSRGEKVLGVDVDPHKLRDLPCRTLHGDAESPPVLQEANLTDAKLFVSTLHIESTNDLFAWRCKTAGVPAAIHAANLQEVANLLEMDVTYMMAPKVDGIQRQNAELLKRGIIRS